MPMVRATTEVVKRPIGRVRLQCFMLLVLSVVLLSIPPPSCACHVDLSVVQMTQPCREHPCRLPGNCRTQRDGRRIPALNVPVPASRLPKSRPRPRSAQGPKSGLTRSRGRHPMTCHQQSNGMLTLSHMEPEASPSSTRRSRVTNAVRATPDLSRSRPSVKTEWRSEESERVRRPAPGRRDVG